MRRQLRACTVLLAAAAVVLPAGCGGSDDDGGPAATSSTATAAAELGPAFGSMAQLPGVLTSAPPWPANNDAQLQLRLRAIGLDPLTEEGQVLHIHQHLDIFVAGKAIAVPANIGIDAAGTFIAALHTHDESGILHVESPTASSYSLGQFFAVWGLRLDARCIGGLCTSGDSRLQAWVNGKPVTSDPTRIVLAEHQQIVLAYGTPAQDPEPVPATHDFEADGV